jgi:hypothetical protein
MATEKFANNPVTTLNGGVSAIDTSVIVTDATPFPVTAQFRLKVESELMLITGVAGNTFTATRGIEGTIAADHSSGVLATHILTAGSLDLLVQTDDPRLSDDRTASGIRTATTVVVTSGATAPSNGQVLTASSSTAAVWATPSTEIPLVGISSEVPLTANSDIVIDTRPASPTGIGRWKLLSIDLRLKTALIGTGSTTVKVGSSIGGSEIVLSQTIINTDPVGGNVGGLALSTLGSAMDQANGFIGLFGAGQTINVNVAVSGVVTDGAVTIYLLWQALS